MSKTFFILLTILVSSNISAKTVSNEKLTIATLQEWDVLHPVSFQTSATESFYHYIFRDMVYRDLDGVVKNDLAEALPSLKNKQAQMIKVNGQKKLIAFWKINAKAKWSDGTPVTCADWQLGWQIGKSDFVSKMEQSFYTKIENIEFEKSDLKKCKVTYKNFDWTFDRDLPPLIPSHLEKKLFEEKNLKASQYEQSSNFVTKPTLLGLYNGPYQVTELKLGSHIVFEPNPYFYGEKPKIKKIIIKFVGNSNTLKPYLLSGEIDAVSSVGFTPDQAIQFSQDSSLNQFEVHFKKAPLYQALMFNQNEFPVNEKAVRVAISKSINKKVITEVFLFNKLNPAETLFSEGDINFVKRDSSYNLLQANEILDKSGWIKKQDGLRYKNNKLLEVQFKTSAGLKFLENVQLVICEDLKKVGIICKNKNEPPRTLLGDTIQKGTFQMTMFGQSFYPDSSLKGQFHSTEIPIEKNNWAGGNFLRFNDQEVNSWLEKIDSEWSQPTRSQLYKKVEQRLIDTATIIPLYHRREAFLSPKKMTGIRTSLKGTAMVFPEYWEIK